MADKKLNEVTKVTDMAYVPVIMADGSIGQIAKADLASVVAAQMGFRKTGNLISDAGASVQLSYGTKVGLGAQKGRYAVYIGYTGGRCAVDYDGSKLTTVYDDTYNWVKIGTSPYEGALNIYIENGNVTVDYRRTEKSSLFYISC